MAEDTQKYCIDSSALIALRDLDMDVFQGIWDTLSELAAKGVIHAPHEVLREVSKIDDVVAKWAKANKRMFFDPDQALADKVVEVQKSFQFFDPERGTPIADPFLVAHGALHGCGVITQELSRKPQESKAKIPDACKHFGVRVMNLSEFFREQGWTFIGQKSAATVH